MQPLPEIMGIPYKVKPRKVQAGQVGLSVERIAVPINRAI